MDTMQEYFIEKALTYGEAERKAREKYGERIVILFRETVKIPNGPFKIFSREGVQITGIIPRNRLRYQEAPAAPPKEKAPPKTLDFNEQKQKFLTDVSLINNKEQDKDNALKEVLAGINSIKERLDDSKPGDKEEQSTFKKLEELLLLNDFPAPYIKALLDRVRKETTLEGLDNFNAVQNKVLEWIGESIKIYDTGRFNVRPRIMILVGPTGVGKTTTVAKLAANFGIDSKTRASKRNVVLVTIDGYRIGAKEQVEKYSEYMQFPCFFTVEYDELKKIIAVNSEGVDLILIDTIGKNPRNMEELGRMKKLLDACGTLSEVYLVVEATTKSSDLKEILQQFESFNYQSVIITKMDETVHTGNVIGVLSEKNKSVSYITNGQGVPADIQKAKVVHFLSNLEGFKVNRIKLEEKFPDRGPNYMQEWQ